MKNLFYKILPSLPMLGLAALNAVFVAVVLYFMVHNPMNRAPDEGIHFEQNVKFIIEHGRLPIAGQDDLAVLRTCRNNELGILPCTNSYAAFPAMIYVTAAMVAKILHGLLGVDYFFGSRAASLLWGVVFVNASFFAVRRILRRDMDALFVCVPFVFIPQVCFVASYTNQDIASLALAAVSFLGVVLLREKLSFGREIFLGAALGLLASAKYNYFALFPWLLLLPWVLADANRIKHRLQWQAALKSCAVVLGVMLVVAAPWYIRNLVLYGDLLGERFIFNKMLEFHPPGKAWPLSIASLGMLHHTGWFSTVFASFFAVFGYMDRFLPDSHYFILKLCLMVTAFQLLYVLARVGSRGLVLGALALVLCVFLCVGASIVHTLHIDYQAQGRYLFPIIVPLIAFVAFLVKARPHVIPWVVCWGGIMATLLCASFSLL